MTMPIARCLFALYVAVVTVAPCVPAPASAAEGELRIGLHVTLAPKWLDPGETEAFQTPYMVLYAVHDALVKPMPAGIVTPSLAESWTESKDHLTYTFACAGTRSSTTATR
jgi:peptide/nickel transport system substrate-binding protein